MASQPTFVEILDHLVLLDIPIVVLRPKILNLTWQPDLANDTFPSLFLEILLRKEAPGLSRLLRIGASHMKTVKDVSNNVNMTVQSCANNRSTEQLN